MACFRLKWMGPYANDLLETHMDWIKGECKKQLIELGRLSKEEVEKETEDHQRDVFENIQRKLSVQIAEGDADLIRGMMKRMNAEREPILYEEMEMMLQKKAGVSASLQFSSIHLILSAVFDGCPQWLHADPWPRGFLGREDQQSHGC